MKTGIKTSSRYHHLGGVLLICFLGAIIYSNTLHSPFVFDDLPNITNNPFIRVINLDFNKLYDAALKSRAESRPVANISFGLNYYFGGYDPTGYHIVNIIIHLVNGILVYCLALIIFQQLSNLSNQSQSPSVPEPSGYHVRFMSLFAALIFVVHPIQTQSVTYIVQRMNSMAAMFCLSSFLLYIHGRLAQRRWKRWTLFSACLLSWFMALGSKEIAVTLPFVAFLYEWYFFQDLSAAWFKKHILYLAVPMAILCCIVLYYMDYHPLEKIAASYTRRDFTVWERVLTQFRVVVFYISLLVYPHPARLNLIHHVTTSHSLLDPISTVLSLLLIAGLIALAVGLARRQRLISFCVLWFFVNLVIESSVIGLEMIYEHRLYLPVFGFALLLAFLLFHFLSSKGSWTVVIAVFLVISLATSTYLRNRTWQDEITLWSDVVAKNPRSARGYLNVGAALMMKGRLDEAISHYQEALKIEPFYVRVHNNLGVALAEAGRVDEALSHYGTALKIKPGYIDAHVNLARALQNIGKIDEAVKHYKKALRIGPNSSDAAEAHNNLAILLEEQGKLDEAISHYEAALRINPNQPDVHYNLALALEDVGKPDQAIAHYNAVLRIRPDDSRAQNHLARVKAISNYRKALQTQPNQAETHESLAVLLVEQGKLDEAVAHFSTALELQPDNAEAHNNLGIVLARQGKLHDAITHFSEALRLQPDFAKARHNLDIALEQAKGPEAPAKAVEPEGEK